jgi:hypothetical protein
MKNWIRILTLGSIVVLGAAACDDTGTAPDLIDDEALRADVALVASDGLFNDLAVMLDPFTLSLVGSGPEFSPTDGSGSYSFTRNVTFFEDDVAKDSYDPLLTDSIHVEWEFEREAEHTFWSAEIERSRDMMVTGLEGEETQRTWNGEAEADIFRSRHKDEVTRTYDMEMEATHTDVVKGVPRIDNPWPLGGTITRHVHVIVMEGDEVIGERDVKATVTFNGTQFVILDVDGEEFEIDLSQRGVKGRMGHRGG